MNRCAWLWLLVVLQAPALAFIPDRAPGSSPIPINISQLPLPIVIDNGKSMPLEVHPSTPGCTGTLLYPVLWMGMRLPLRGIFWDNMHLAFDLTKFIMERHITDAFPTGPTIRTTFTSGGELRRLIEPRIFIQLNQDRVDGKRQGNLVIRIQGPRDYLYPLLSNDSRLTTVLWDVRQLQIILEDDPDILTALDELGALYFAARVRILNAKELHQFRWLHDLMFSPVMVKQLHSKVHRAQWKRVLLDRIAQTFSSKKIPLETAKVKMEPRRFNARPDYVGVEDIPDVVREDDTPLEPWQEPTESELEQRLADLRKRIEGPPQADTLTLHFDVERSDRGREFLKNLARSKPTLFDADERAILQGPRGAIDPTQFRVALVVMEEGQLKQGRKLRDGLGNPLPRTGPEQPAILVGRVRTGKGPRSEVLVWSPDWNAMTRDGGGQLMSALTIGAEARAQGIVFEGLRFLLSNDVGEEIVDPFIQQDSPFRW